MGRDGSQSKKIDKASKKEKNRKVKNAKRYSRRWGNGEVKE